MKALLISLLIVVLSACGAGPHAISEGTLRDSIFSIEPRLNGLTTIWMTHDDVGAYCTSDAAIVSEANRIIASETAEVVMIYRSLNNNDPEYGSFFNSAAGCAGEGKNVTIYLILSIKSVTSLELQGGE